MSSKNRPDGQGTLNLVVKVFQTRLGMLFQALFSMLLETSFEMLFYNWFPVFFMNMNNDEEALIGPCTIKTL